MSVAPKTSLILMAEDDSDDRLLAQEALTESGITVDLRFVEDGVELMDYLNRRKKFSSPENSPRPGLIILDLNMPRKDGREALREIKLDPELKRIPVVVMTTSTAEPDIAKVYDLGANSFISKPVAFNSLVGLMKSVTDYWFNVVVPPAKG
ncbi:MAG: response regulator [Pedosphaera sp.]|nr:response regulator [Pedosphaera sp.]